MDDDKLVDGPQPPDAASRQRSAASASAAVTSGAAAERKAQQRAKQALRRRTQAREQTIGRGAAWLARWSLRLVAIVLGLIVLGLLIRYTWSIVLPVSLAMIFTTVLQPPAYFLERRLKLPPAMAAAMVLLGSFWLIAMLIYVMAPSVADQSTDLADDAVTGINRLSEWLASSDLGVSANQIDEMLNSAEERIKDSAGTIASGVLVGVNMATNIVINMVLALVLTFLFIKDGRRFLPWVKENAGPTAGPHLYEVGNRVWSTLGGFIRTQALVSFIDAVFIYIGLLAVGVPLAFPLAVITFFAGFIPIIGAFSAGALAVLVALVSVGPVKALIVLGIIIAVQQLEGNVLSPMLQSRSMNLHAAVVLLSVTLGGSLFGIIGAFLAVPVAAIIAVVLRYLNEQVALNSTDPDPEPDEEGDTVINPPDDVPAEARYREA